MKQLSIAIAFLLISFSTQEIVTRENTQSEEALTIQKLENIYKTIKKVNQIDIEPETSVTLSDKVTDQPLERALGGKEDEQKKGNEQVKPDGAEKAQSGKEEVDGEEKAKSDKEKVDGENEATTDKDKKPDDKKEGEKDGNKKTKEAAKKDAPPKKVAKMAGGILINTIEGDKLGKSSTIFSILSVFVLVLVTLLG